jgi:hypothetical protein
MPLRWAARRLERNDAEQSAPLRRQSALRYLRVATGVGFAEVVLAPRQ